MKIRNILYISLVLLIAGCTNEENFSDTLSGNGKKTPLLINATLDTGKGITRASGGDFVDGDVLKAYFRHLDHTDAVIAPDYGKKLVTITYDNGTFTSDSYWDDFSNSASADTDLRTANHSLQSFYGYCYNGGSPSTALTEATGVLGWTVQTNQSTAAAVQHSDILWSPTQAKNSYTHGASNVDDHGTFTLPFTHAMSEITVTVKTNEGFVGSTDGSKKPLYYTTLTLFKMGTVTTLTAPTSTWVAVPGTEDANIQSITMCGGPYSDYSTTNNFKDRNYTAIVAPGTKLKQGEKLLEIINADGNNYSVTITEEMVNNTHWASGHAADQYGAEENSDGLAYVITQPGKNYHLDVTIKKSAVQAHSTLANWTDVNATANGDIYFPDDVDVIIDDSYDGTDESKSPTPVQVETIDKDQFVNGASFSLFRVQATDYNTYNLGNDLEAPKDHVARLNENYAFESISTFTNIGGTPVDYWTNTPELYWPNNSAKFYYRALAKFNGSTGVAPNIVNNIEKVGTIPSDKGTSVSQGGNDILWGTTPKHYGYTYQKTYEKSYPIPPRTHGVPIVFEHAMSKVSFTLETTNDASVLPNNAKMELSEASFNISNLYTEGTIRIDDGNIDLTGSTSDAISVYKGGDTNQQTRNLVTDLIVVPQTLGDDVIVTITFTDSGSNIYSTYTIPLNQCVVSEGSTPITAWERGKNYSYTIKIKKEAVQFHALVKDWEDVTGSGTASLVW